ncbi:MAG: aminotransferase DegT [Nitrospirales bacterium]|nr:MAG: aminotransferase DegT [Nitrospirales bacterium]
MPSEVMEWKVPFLDLRITDKAARQEILSAVENVLCHGQLVLGKEVHELEVKIAIFCGRKYAVGVNSGTDALYLGLKSLGVGPGSEVITTSLSWVATANAIAMTGATPVFADIGEDLNIDPECVRRLITSRTKAVMPVHYTGKVCQMEALSEIAAEYDLAVVEDASQAFGARYHDQIAGSFGSIGCFSMNPMKVLGACGEAGMIVMDREDIYDRLLALRYNGTVNKEVCIEPSLNGRLDTIQAAILLKRLSKIDWVIERRRELASWYDEQLTGLVETPRETQGGIDVFYTYIIRTRQRDALMAFLRNKGVETKIRHPSLMSEQPAYLHCPRAEMLNASGLVKEILSLPIHEKLARTDVCYVTECVQEFFQETKEV